MITRLLSLLLILTLGATACASDSESTSSDTGAIRESTEGDGGSDVSDDAAVATDDEATDDAAAEGAAEPIGGADLGDAASDEDAMSEGDTEDVVDAVESSSGVRSKGGDVSGSSEAELDIIDDDRPPQPTPEAGLLTAADIDDNLNNEFFVRWLEGQAQQLDLSLDLRGRIAITVLDANDVGLGNTEVSVSNGEKEITLYTDSAGKAWLYPAYVGFAADDDFSFTVIHAGLELGAATSTLSAQEDSGSVTIRTEATNELPSALDLALVLDTTGSMTDELRYLTVELESIISNVEADYPNRDIRVALVVYRDNGSDEEYVTRVFDFDTVSAISDDLAAQVANGGGDFPEAMDVALNEAAENLSWRSGSNLAKVLILNADAPPHSQDINTTLDIGRTLGADGVRIYPLAASGVDRTAEAVMRTLAATTGGRHLFLTADSGIGGEKLEPKVECYHVTALDDLLQRIIATELAGERIDAAPEAIRRTVGNPQAGVCT